MIVWSHIRDFNGFFLVKMKISTRKWSFPLIMSDTGISFCKNNHNMILLLYSYYMKSMKWSSKDNYITKVVTVTGHQRRHQCFYTFQEQNHVVFVYFSLSLIDSRPWFFLIMHQYCLSTSAEHKHNTWCVIVELMEDLLHCINALVGHMQSPLCARQRGTLPVLPNKITDEITDPSPGSPSVAARHYTEQQQLMSVLLYNTYQSAITAEGLHWKQQRE